MCWKAADRRKTVGAPLSMCCSVRPQPAYDSSVTGIILTVLMDDGASGMWATKRSGGTTLCKIPMKPNILIYPFRAE